MKGWRDVHERSKHTMENLFLNSLTIRNFRGFSRLRIERLGRVNVIAGKNNTGKSSLLEALQLYAYNGNPFIIWKILQAGDEDNNAYQSRSERLSHENLLRDLRHLFYGRKEAGQSVQPAVVGPIDSPNSTLSISIGWYVRQSEGEDEVPEWRALQPGAINITENASARFAIEFGKSFRTYPIRPEPPFLTDQTGKANCIAIAPHGLDRELIGALWDAIALTELEKDVVDAMRILAPGVERLSIVGNLDVKDRLIRNINTRERKVIPIVKGAGTDEPIALRSLGDGMQRLFGLALALVNTKDGTLLIDEFENGLHYSVQSDIWHFIFQLARRLNVQVFATTHSSDCIKAFQEAARDDIQSEGVFIRLESKKGEINAVLYEAEELATATREQLEVR
jgi:hypothetical protein